MLAKYQMNLLQKIIEIFFDVQFLIEIFEKIVSLKWYLHAWLKITQFKYSRISLKMVGF